MERGHVAPITTVVLACTLTVGALLLAPRAEAEPSSGDSAGMFVPTVAPSAFDD
jgi:hypothetical protein